MYHTLLYGHECICGRCLKYTDVGFMVYDSFGKGVEFDNTGGVTDDYKRVLLRTAQSLSTRFSSKTGVIQSWSAGPHCKLHPQLNVQYPVIIDNMV
jgi:unsaturated chondroitin disaccharide hydrolase